MNTEEYYDTWKRCPIVRPQFKLTEDLVCGGITYPMGTLLLGLDSTKSFLAPDGMRISAPISKLTFLNYVAEVDPESTILSKVK